ncbi:uncharacterized protein LOC133329258, partial [Musca vetustissima]|uniref:uncharacterized protein LOC133329258 n=1 Tax=Musca vetustissima TaxID=27455 RepID=UPI002AB5E75B
MAKFLCKIWNKDRSKKKAFMCEASIDLIIQKAKGYSIDGNRLVIESDGTDIEDDETLQCILEEKQVLIILNSAETWSPGNVVSDPVPHHSMTNIENSSSALDNRTAVPTQTFLNMPCTTPGSTDESIFIALSEPENIGQNFVVTPQSVSADTITITSDEEFITMFSPSDKLNTTFQQTPTDNKNRPDCDSFQNFEIPWSKMPHEVLKVLNKKEKIGKLINSFCNVIVDEIRQKTNFIPMNVYRNIAHIAATKYPDSFVEKDGEGRIMSYTPISLVTTMRNRNNFLNYSSKAKKSIIDIPIKKRKHLSALSRSCAHWQPDISAEKCNDVDYKKQILISMYHKKTLHQSELETAKTLMSSCFATQRAFFNDAENIPSVKDILNNWPMIFHKDCLFDHFQKLMDLNIKIFNENFEISKSKFNTCFNIEHTQGANGIVEAICNYFKERTTLLYKEFKFGATMDDIKRENESATPWVSIICTSPTGDDEQHIAYIWLEGEITSIETNSNLISLILQLLCYYYIFNIEYPKDISQSCEFFMRYLFKFYPCH